MGTPKWAIGSAAGVAGVGALMNFGGSMMQANAIRNAASKNYGRRMRMIGEQAKADTVRLNQMKNTGEARIGAMRAAAGMSGTGGMSTDLVIGGSAANIAQDISWAAEQAGFNRDFAEQSAIEELEYQRKQADATLLTGIGGLLTGGGQLGLGLMI